jgi:ribulose bisphosphate carboxylase small subunit
MKVRITILLALVAAGCVQRPTSRQVPQASTSPTPSVQPCVIPTPVPIAYPSGKRIVRPSFEDKQTEAQIDQILADGTVHDITVLFLNSVKFRVRQGEGDVRGQSGWGIIALNDQCDALASLNALLQQYQFKSIHPITVAPEAQLEAEKQLRDSKADQEYRQEVGSEPNAPYDSPNDGSWATLRLDAYTPQKAKNLLLALQKHPAVRSATIHTTVGSV